MTLNLNTFDPIVDTGLQAPYTAAPGYGSDSSSSKSSSSKKESQPKTGFEDVIKNIMEVMSKGKALPSDVWTYMTQMQDIITHAYDPTTGNADLTMFKYMLTDIAKVTTGYEEWNKMKDMLEKNGTTQEAAIDSRGFVYVMDPLAGLMTKSISEVTNNDRLLTNGELLQARKDDPNFAYNTRVFSTISNGVNPGDITKQVMNILSQIKSTGGKSEQFFGLNGKALQTLQELGNSIESGYITQKLSNSSNVKQLEEAYKYIVQMLPNNMQACLQLKAAQNNTSVSSILNSIVSSQIHTQSDTSYEISEPTKQTDSSSSDIKMTALMQYQSDMGGTKGKEVINPGQSYALSIPATKYSQILNTEGNPIQNCSLLTLRDSGMGSIGIMNQGIYVGNQFISPTNYNQVAIQTGGMSRAWLPSIIESNGIEHPDFNILKDFAKLNEQLEKATSIAEKKALIQEDSKFSKYFRGIDEEGNIQWDPSKFKPYFMVQAFASGETGWMGDVKGVLNPNTLEGWGTDIKYMGVKNEETFMQDYIKDYSGAKEDIYAAIAYIPVNPSTSDTMTASGQNPILSKKLDSSKSTDIRVLQDKQNLNPGLMKLPQ